MSSTPMFATSFKVSRCAVDFNSKLGPYIADDLKDDPAKFADAVGQIGQLRTAVAGEQPLPSAQGSIEKLSKYVGQLKALTVHFPINQGEKVRSTVPHCPTSPEGCVAACRCRLCGRGWTPRHNHRMI